MDTVDDHFPFDDDSLSNEARALSRSVELIRRARGLKNPRDCPPGTEEWTDVSLDFVRDLRWALGMNDRDDAED
ncbi:hypothetical protein [Burkholderia sp. 8Y]|uniref:hypothetical protein n=1 Tax=Burkholderia sp. 8Y TaxID=2653133 RepID=UPI00135B54B3|nr:hypothetical protein [Burkholderia sp. 8Y]